MMSLVVKKFFLPQKDLCMCFKKYCLFFLSMGIQDLDPTFLVTGPSCTDLVVFLFVCLFRFLFLFFVFCGLHPWHMEVPRLGV